MIDDEEDNDDILDTTDGENNDEMEDMSENSSSTRNFASRKARAAVSGETKKAVAKAATKKSLLAPLATIFMYIFIAIVIIIVLVGICMFISTLPGMVMERLKQLTTEIGDSLASYFGADSARVQVKPEQIYDIMDYLDEMGYDLKSDGFLTDYKDESDAKANQKAENGVIKDEDGKIVSAESEFIFTYLMADNYTYTIANTNMVAGDGSGGIFNALLGFGTRIVEAFFGSSENNRRGLIHIYNDNGIIGNKGTFYERGFLINEKDKIDIKASTKKLTITRDEGIFSSTKSIEYNLDGWTGRYGLPIDFLLSLHLATKMPDLCYDIATSFNTKLYLLLHEISGDSSSVEAAFRTETQDGSYIYVRYSQMEDIVGHEFYGIGLNAKEALQILRELNIPSPPNCQNSEEIGGDIEDSASIISTRQVYGDQQLNDAKNDFVNKYNALIDEINSKYSINISKVNSYEDIENWLDEDTAQEKNKDVTGIENYIEYRKGDHRVEWNYDGNAYRMDMDFTHNYFSITDEYGSQMKTIVLTVNYTIVKVWNEDEMQEHLNGGSFINCSNSTNIDEACSVCEQYVEKIYHLLKDARDTNFDFAQPYISSVEDHWFRDVYFVADDSNTKFVDYDYDYESVMKERWTLYETYEDGEHAGDFKLYRLDNGDLYDGTQEEANNEGISVVKKAKLVRAGDNSFEVDGEVYNDWNWQKIGDKWSAYSVSSQISAGSWVQLYPDDSDEVKQKIYTQRSVSGNLEQIGEGQRAETNEKIKHIFLDKKYFKYDKELDAEVIKKLRDKYNLGYGSIDEDDMDKSVTVNIGDEEKEYKVSDFAQNVEITQNSLNEFSMLERTHTLDADYVYRDFKELAVELGYFKKEELTDETPKLLQWIVPDTGSNGFPKRIIDKHINEDGTMIHSKGDIDVSIRELIKATGGSNSENGPSLDDGTEIIDSEDDIQEEVGAQINPLVQVKTIENNVSVGASSGATGSGGSFKKDNLLDTATACWQYIVDSGRYTYAGASIPPTSGSTIDCSSFVSWILYEYGYQEFAGPQHCTVNFYTTNWNEAFGWEEIPVGPGEDCSSIVQPGDLFVRDDGGNNGHIQFIYAVENNGEKIITYDCGASSHWVSANRDGYVSDFTKGDSKNRPGKIIRIEDPSNSNNKEGEPYRGYTGNEAVVSPVTGILLDYGTYDGTYASTTGEIYRTNVDLKYGPTFRINVKTEEGETVQENQGEEFQSVEQVDKVGYALIKVLSVEDYLKLEQIANSYIWGSGSLVNVGENGGASFEDKLKIEDQLGDNNLDGNDNDSWSELDKTIYGYKEFAELYQKYGIGGYTILIDGFKCEQVDEELAKETKKNQEPTEIPHGEAITMNDFKISKDKLDDEDELMPSKYEIEDEYKMASITATNRLNAESKVKEEANPSISMTFEGEELIFIKEGTVLGRTITDKELIEEYRENKLGTYEELRGRDLSNQKFSVIGNYLRIEMTDLKGSIVENVEEYMKLDDGKNEKKNTDVEWELFYFSPYEGGGWDGEGHGPEAVKDEFSMRTTYNGSYNYDVGIIQWTTNASFNNISEFCRKAVELDSSLCSPLAKYIDKDYNYFNNQASMTQLQQDFTAICAKDRDAFTQIQIEIAKEEYLTPVLQTYPWLESRKLVVQGTALSYCVCRGGSPAGLSESMSDDEIIDAIMSNFSSDSRLASRIPAQTYAAKAIASGGVSDEEIEQWVRTQTPPGGDSSWLVH